jgi:hypothetical protein
LAFGSSTARLIDRVWEARDLLARDPRPARTKPAKTIGPAGGTKRRGERGHSVGCVERPSKSASVPGEAHHSHDRLEQEQGGTPGAHPLKAWWVRIR